MKSAESAPFQQGKEQMYAKTWRQSHQKNRKKALKVSVMSLIVCKTRRQGAEQGMLVSLCPKGSSQGTHNTRDAAEQKPQQQRDVCLSAANMQPLLP